MSSTVIWYVHPYAGGPNVGRYDRPYHLCGTWNNQGVQSVIITANNHHLLDHGKRAGGELNKSVQYEFLSTPKYKGNGFGRLYNMACFSFGILWSARRLRRNYGKPNLIIYSSPHPYAAISVKLLSFIYKAKTVFEVRDLWPLSLIELAGVSAKHPLVYLTYFLEKFCYKTFDFTVSLLPSTIEYMKARGLQEDKWRYIPNGVFISQTATDDVLIDDDYDCLRQVIAWRKKGFFIVAYTGAFGKPNNVDSLIESTRLVKNQRIKIILVGRGDQEEALRKKIVEYGLLNRISVFGQVPKQVVQRLLSIVDVGYISLLSQPIFRFGISPNKLYDYMQASLPVLFAVKCQDDPVSDARCGFTADPEGFNDIADKIDQLSMLSKERLKTMGRNGFQKVCRDHDYQRLAQRYLELLNRREGL